MSRFQWYAPLDPDCPEVRSWYEDLWNDPMTQAIPSDVIGDLTEDWEKKHRSKCKRCSEYGAANIEVR